MSVWEYDPEANAAYLHLSPDRDTPGTSATHCTSPTTSASRQRISLSLRL